MSDARIPCFPCFENRHDLCDGLIHLWVFSTSDPDDIPVQETWPCQCDDCLCVYEEFRRSQAEETVEAIGE